jgi:hypothetical protein
VTTAEFTPEQYRAAIIELMQFVTTHLDPDPSAQWAAYVTSPEAIKVIAHTQINWILQGLSREAS